MRARSSTRGSVARKRPSRSSGPSREPRGAGSAQRRRTLLRADAPRPAPLPVPRDDADRANHHAVHAPGGIAAAAGDGANRSRRGAGGSSRVARPDEVRRPLRSGRGMGGIRRSPARLRRGEGRRPRFAARRARSSVDPAELRSRSEADHDHESSDADSGDAHRSRDDPAVGDFLRDGEAAPERGTAGRRDDRPRRAYRGADDRGGDGDRSAHRLPRAAGAGGAVRCASGVRRRSRRSGPGGWAVRRRSGADAGRADARICRVRASAHRPGLRMTVRRLLAAAAIFHVAVTILLFVGGRMAVAPQLVDHDGILTATSDSVTYESHALRPGAWRDRSEWFHVRLLSPFYRVLAPLGPGILAAEPLNLFCYLAIVALTFAIGREALDERAGIIAGAVVALWPTFVLHTTQLLKDPLFIAATLAFVFVVMTWLTTTYDWRHVIAAAILLIAAAVLLYMIRWQFGVIVLALVVFGFVLLIARQIIERRLLLRNLACGVIAVAAALSMASQSNRTLTKVKTYPSASRGESKALDGGAGKRVPAVIVWVARTDRTGIAVGGVRARYNLSDAGARSPIDEE